MSSRVGDKLTYAARLGLLLLVYVATAKLGLKYGALAGVATTVWPPTGVALAAMTLGGRRLWPAVFLGALIVNATTGIPWGSALIIACGNTLEALAGAALFARLRFQRRLERLQDVLLLALVALLAPAVSATFGVAAMLAGPVTVPQGLPTFWLVWWVGDVLGVLLYAPVILAAASLPRLDRRPARWLEAGLLALTLAGVSLAVFCDLFPWRVVALIRGTYSIWPVLIWAALRFRQQGTAAALLGVSFAAIAGTAAGQGVFASEQVHERLLRAQLFMAVTAVSMMMLAAALAERRQALQARDEFISIASHELRTPLTALRLRVASVLRLLRRQDGEAGPGGTQSRAEVDQKVSRLLAAAETTGDRLSRLIEDLLDVSRLTAGRLELQLEEVAVVPLVHDVVANLRDQAAEAGSAITVDVGATDQAAVASWDRVRVEQVLTNLVANAVKYGGGKEISAVVRLELDDVLITISDRGIGVAPPDQARIFHAFERVDGPHRVGGLGLGLYIGRRIAEAHGGTLTMTSELGRGSTFALRLPKQAAAA